MKSLICLGVLALGLGFAQSASAGTRLEEGAMGAAAGALVGGPIGAVAGGAIGYTGGHAIAHGIFHDGHRHYYWRHGHRHYYR
jgi:hypothetical protein